MIYFDHSASTIPSKSILEKYVLDNLLYPGNSNSPHDLGKVIKDKIEETSNNILSLLNLNDNYEVIYTSGSSESNNLAIKGLIQKYNIKHIITDQFEHSSVIAPASFLQKNGVIVDFVKFNEKGLIDLDNLNELITDDATLVTIASVNSELGFIQNIDEIKNIIKNKDNCYFHCDATQSIGKVNINLNDIDLISFSAHKFYGLKGIGVLIHKKDIKLISQIQGGSSTTSYRSGTPAHPLIFSIGYAIEEVIKNLDNNINKVKELNEYLINKLKVFNNLYINSNEYSTPHIVNVSFIGYESLDIVLKLSENGIYISNHSACSSDKKLSMGVYNLTHDESRSLSSIRISLSHTNTKEEIDELINKLKEII